MMCVEAAFGSSIGGLLTCCWCFDSFDAEFNGTSCPFIFSSHQLNLPWDLPSTGRDKNQDSAVKMTS